MTLSEAFAHFIQHPVPLGEEEVYLCTRSILDTVGAMVLGSRTGVVEKAARVIPRAGKATLAGIGGGFSARDAAFLNGISGHELELDDTSSSNLGHPTVAVLPALLALGEELNSPGEELIRAFAVATEVECKLGRLCAHALHERGWHASSVTGIVGAAAGAAYLLKLKEKELVNCLGIALDGREGYLYEYSGLRFDPFGSDWYKTLGNRYDVCTPGFAIKQYPSCSSTHRAVDAFVDLAQVHHFQPEDIASIRVELSAAALRELVTPEPRTGDEAKFSVGFQVALYLSGLDNMPDNYTEKIIFRPDIQRIIKATHLCHAERYDALPVDMGVGPAFVSVTLLDGTEYHTERIYPVGHRTDPISDQALEEKFLRCTRPVLGEEQARVLCRTLWKLKDDAVTNLMRQTVPILR